MIILNGVKAQLFDIWIWFTYVSTFALLPKSFQSSSQFVFIIPKNNATFLILKYLSFSHQLICCDHTFLIHVCDIDIHFKLCQNNCLGVKGKGLSCFLFWTLEPRVRIRPYVIFLTILTILRQMTRKPIR